MTLSALVRTLLPLIIIVVQLKDFRIRSLAYPSQLTFPSQHYASWNAVGDYGISFGMVGLRNILEEILTHGICKYTLLSHAHFSMYVAYCKRVGACLCSNPICLMEFHSISGYALQLIFMALLCFVCLVFLVCGLLWQNVCFNIMQHSFHPNRRIIEKVIYNSGFKCQF